MVLRTRHGPPTRMEDCLSPCPPDTTSLPATRDAWPSVSTWPTVHSPARGVQGQHLSPDGSEAMSLDLLRALSRAGGTHPGGTRLLRSGAQAYLPAKGLRVWKEARVLACLLSSSECPSSMKPLERRAPVSWSVGSEDGAPTPLAGGTLVLLSCPSAGGRAERWWARQAQDQAPPLRQPEARW